MQKKKIHQEFDLIVHICESNYVLVLIFPLRSSTHILFLLFLHISPKTWSSSVSKINCFYRKLKSESKSVRFLSRIFHDYAIKHNRDSLRSHNNCLFILLSLSHIDTSCAKENRENEVFLLSSFHEPRSSLLRRSRYTRARSTPAHHTAALLCFSFPPALGLSSLSVLETPSTGEDVGKLKLQIRDRGRCKNWRTFTLKVSNVNRTNEKFKTVFMFWLTNFFSLFWWVLDGWIKWVETVHCWWKEIVVMVI